VEAGYVSNIPPHCFRGRRAAGILLAVAWLCLAAAAGDMSAQPARQSPDWFAKGLLYQVQLRAFSPEGTLKGAEARLQHIKDIGATVVYLVPVFKMDEDVNEEFWSPRQIKSGFGNPRNQYRIIDLSGRTLRESSLAADREEITLSSKTNGIVIVVINGKTFKVNY